MLKRRGSQQERDDKILLEVLVFCFLRKAFYPMSRACHFIYNYAFEFHSDDCDKYSWFQSTTAHNLGYWLRSISAKLIDDDVFNDDIDMMMAAPPSLQKSVISTDTAFSLLLLRDELPRSKIEVFLSLWSRPISYSMKLDPTRSIWLLTVVMCLSIMSMTLPEVSSLNWKVLLGDRSFSR